MRIKRVLKEIVKKRRLSVLRKSFVNDHHDVSSYNKENVADYRKQGFSLSDSACYDLKHNDYRNYISTWEGYLPRLDNAEFSLISDNKYLFYLTCSHFVRTPRVYALIRKGALVSVGEHELTSENLYDFALKTNGIVIKDASGSDGFDVYVLKQKNGALFYKNKAVDAKDVADMVKKFKNGIVQEKIEQGAFENEIFPDSVNTVRVISMKKPDADEHEIVAALQRIGTAKSAPVDNFNQGGASALIDVETGEIGKLTSLFYLDENGQRVFYERHPDSGAVLCGRVIPHWEELKAMIAETTRKMPFFKLIAWDIVVLDDGFAVIEINTKSSMNVFQIHRGLRSERLGEYYRRAGYLTD